MKQLEVATPQVFQLRCSMQAQNIDHKSVSVFKPQNWEKKVAKEDLENSSYESERYTVCFLFINNLSIFQAVPLKFNYSFGL